MKLTKEELEILKNAPEGAEWYGLSSRVEFYKNITQYDYDYYEYPNAWYKGIGLPVCDPESIADLRKRNEQEDKQAKIVDAVNWLQAELTDDNCYFRNENELYLSTTSGRLKYLALDNKATGTVCTIDEFNQCVKEMAEAEWLYLKFEGDTGIYHYGMYKESFEDDSTYQLGQKPLEWVNGDDCIWNGRACLFIGTTPLNRELAIIEFTQGCMTELDRVWIAELSKPLTAEEKAAKEREDKTKALYLVAFKGDDNWSGEAGSVAAIFYDMIDAGVKLPE